MNGRPMFVGRHSSPIPGILLVLAIPVLFAVGIGIRLWVWPARGLAGDIDQFVLWVHGIAVNGWQNAYDQNLSFPAVMAWVWGALAWAEPAFRTVTASVTRSPTAGFHISAPAAFRIRKSESARKRSGRSAAAYCAVASKSFVTVAGAGGFQTPVKVQPASALTVTAGNAAPLVTVTT